MRVATTGGRILEAELRSVKVASAPREILHVGGWPMGPREAMSSRLRLLDATAEEERSLLAAGYTLPQTEPEAGGRQLDRQGGPP